jgi:DNA mismatch endonuclease (patch repair protein)
VFCDGDFWHGRDLAVRLAKLAKGHNAPYWVAKIQTNVARDRRHDAALAANGWTVLRYWESDVIRNASAIASEVFATVLRLRGSVRQS